jgi:riboflavin kinase/FMN adenylyltransferase
MIVHKGYENLNLLNPVVTMGIFDGVHRGHKTLLERLVSKAKEANGESVVITFSPHPRLILDQKKENLSFLTTMEEKMVLLENADVDHLIVIEFNRDFSNIPACDFVKDVLVEKIGMKMLLIGFNHHFGKKGEGDFNTMKACSEMFGFQVEQVQGLYTEEGTISSSSIRDALLKGKLDDANRWLGYTYSVRGTVVEGRKIGRILGYATANIKPDYRYKMIPANGVYAVKVEIGGSILPGMLSIGTNPTVNNDPRIRSIEVHILNFDENIYGKTISVLFIKRLRDEKKFVSTEALAEQMKADKQQVQLLLT